MALTLTGDERILDILTLNEAKRKYISKTESVRLLSTSERLSHSVYLPQRFLSGENAHPTAVLPNFGPCDQLPERSGAYVMTQGDVWQRHLSFPCACALDS